MSLEVPDLTTIAERVSGALDVRYMERGQERSFHGQPIYAPTERGWYIGERTGYALFYWHADFSGQREGIVSIRQGEERIYDASPEVLRWLKEAVPER